MILRKISSILILSLLVALRLAAQENSAGREWGEIPLDQLKMKDFPSDSNASAVVLFDCGTASFDAQYELMFTHYTRIKILSKGGFDLGTVSVDYYTGDNTERLRDLKGQTISLDAQGNVVKQEMDDNAVFKEELLNKWERTKFTLPSLAPGCIIEYRYTIYSTSPHYLRDWVFQTSEPVLWSEYEIKTPVIFQYAKVTETNRPFDLEFNEMVKETFVGPSGPKIVTMNHSHWVMKDVPALRKEPYMTTVADFTQKVTFQLAVVNWPNEPPIKILQTWSEVSDKLNGHEKFGSRLGGNGDVRKIVEGLTAGITDTTKKIEAIYNFIRNTIVWDGVLTELANRSLGDVLESKKGSAGEINLLLTAMLREAGIQAYPVILSTRSNGRIQDVYPIVNQFNYVIADVKVNNKTMLLDATDRLRSMSLLPYRALNHRGLLIDEDHPSWISIEPTGEGSSVSLGTLAVQEDGKLTGTFDIKYSGYTASRERSDFAEKKPDEYVKSAVKSTTMGFTVDTFVVSNKDSVDLPFSLHVTVSSDRYVQVVDSFLYVNPMTIERTLKNPFQLEKRSFPVDFAYPSTGTYVVNLTIPEGYNLQEYPQNMTASLPGGGGSYSRMCTINGNVFQLMTKYRMDKIIVEPQQYAGLRKMYEQIVSAESEQLVLKKKPLQPSSKTKK